MAQFIIYPENASHAVLAPEISVLVPVMNEAGNVRPLIDEICYTFQGRPFEIIYIDDGSTDETEAELQKCVSEIKELRVLRHKKRSGQSVAIRTGLLASRAPLIAVLDGDGQNIPADLQAQFQYYHDYKYIFQLMILPLVAFPKYVYRNLDYNLENSLPLR